MRRVLGIYAFLFFSGTCFGQFNFDSLLSSNPALKRVGLSPQKFHLQILFTRIERSGEKPVLTTYSYNVKPENYLYCASLVKLPTSILALQKLNELKLNPGTTMITDSSRTCHFKVNRDSSSTNGLPSVAHYIKKMCLVSDNASFSRTYEFLGVDYIHGNLSKMGFPDVRIINRYDGNCLGKDNLITNPVNFMDDNFKIIYRQEEQVAAQSYLPVLKSVKIGKAYKIGNKMVRAPKEFTYSNYLTLADCHRILLELIFEKNHLFNITEAQRSWLLRQLTMYPRQSYSPKYDPKEFYDAYKKYLFFGAGKEPITDTTITVTNVVGQSYGFMSDCAYFKNSTNGIEFILSAGLYANEDGIIDGKYDYKNVALPFLAELGRAIYNYEKEQRSKQK
ncbi:MAG: serine hydrolase [Bacteroidia bacterium]|nr:serine hydrolase [Bacteroidia bacterium]